MHRRSCWVAAFTDDGLLPEARRFGRKCDGPHRLPASATGSCQRRGVHHLDERTELPAAEREALLGENASVFLGLNAVT
jgi:hypothetical protein